MYHRKNNHVRFLKFYCFVFFFNVNRFFSLYIIFYYSREIFCLLPYENHLQRKKKFFHFIVSAFFNYFSVKIIIALVKFDSIICTLKYYLSSSKYLLRNIKSFDLLRCSYRINKCSCTNIHISYV